MPNVLPTNLLLSERVKPPHFVAKSKGSKDRERGDSGGLREGYMNGGRGGGGGRKGRNWLKQ